MVTNISAPLAPAAMAFSERSLSSAIPRSIASPPLAEISAASASALELTIWLGPIGSPGRTISLPVASRAIRGRRRTTSQGTFMAAARPMSRAPRIRPAETPRSPALKSRPAGRMYWPLTGFSRTVTRSPSASASSWMTTASAPSGTGPPVKTRTVWPRLTVPE